MRRFAIVATALLVGCASGTEGLVTTARTPATTEVVTAAGEYEINTVMESRVSSHWVRVPIGRAWTALPAVYEGIGLRGSVVDADEHAFGVREVRVSRRLAGERLSEFLTCGVNPIGAPLADTYSVWIDMVTRLRDQGGGTEVRTQLEARAEPRGTSGSTVRCASTGELEKRIAETVTARSGS